MDAVIVGMLCSEMRLHVYRHTKGVARGVSRVCMNPPFAIAHVPIERQCSERQLHTLAVLNAKLSQSTVVLCI